MNKFKLLTGLFSLVLLISCSKEEFQYNPYKPTLADVDSIYFSAGDLSLIADGQAQLKFIVETFRRVKRDNAPDTMQIFDYRLLPAGSLKVLESVSGKEVGMTYSTSSIPQDTVRFFASIGTKKSLIGKVFLRPKPTLPSKVYVDVIFHVWELNPTNVAYDPSSYQAINYQQLVDGLNTMNQVVSNKIGSNPNGASANVEFRLAKINPSGLSIPQPGFNKIIYSDEVKANPLIASISLSDFSQFINKTPTTYIWTPEKYLNIHILPSGSNNALGNAYPAKQLAAGTGQTLITGISTIATGPTDYIRDFSNAAIFLPRTLFFPGYERRVEIFSYIGNFYGLYPTSSYSAARTHSDFCMDTQEYNPSDGRNNFVSPIKISLKDVKFITDYAMDDTRYPSSRNSLTLDQITRMRAVMARCPGRMNSYP